MPKCDFCRAEGATQRCSKCQGCWSCNRVCAKRFWPTHKRFCTDDPALRPHVPVELAFERELAKAPKSDAPAEVVVCYICLERDGPDGETLMRGCACRGPSAGYAHPNCLAELAAHTPKVEVDGSLWFNQWIVCATCRQEYYGALRLEMARRAWRMCRDDGAPAVAEYAVSVIGGQDFNFQAAGEDDAAERVSAAIKRTLSRGDPNSSFSLKHELTQVRGVSRAGRPQEALDMLTPLRPRIEQCGHEDILIEYAYYMASIFCKLRRAEEALPVITEAVERGKRLHGTDAASTLQCIDLYAKVLAYCGRLEESKDVMTQVVAAQTRLLGEDHPKTLKAKGFYDELLRTFPRTIESSSRTQAR